MCAAPARHFQVLAGNAAIRDIGTIFTVKVNAEAVVVTVVEGAIQLSAPHEPEQLINKNQQAYIESTVRAKTLTPPELAREMSWRQDPQSGTLRIGGQAVPPPSTTDVAGAQETQSKVCPAGVLIFIEAIAWFLLRQSRSLMEDHKWFYREYMKRVNKLAAAKERLLLASSLLGEDFSERLKAGETTESLEKLKIPEDGPIREILTVIESFYDGGARNKTTRSGRADG